MYCGRERKDFGEHAEGCTWDKKYRNPYYDITFTME